MDKEKFKISVRLNGKEQPYEEVSAAREVSDEKGIDDDQEILEEKEITLSNNIIDFAKKQKEKNHPVSPYWDDGNHEKIPKFPFHHNRKKGKKGKLNYSLKNLPLTLIIASVSAIIVGISLGITMLTLFTGTDEQAASAEIMGASAAVSDVRLSDMRVEFVQGGAFSTYEKGKEMATAFQDRGQAGILASNTENYYLFIGLGTNREGADKISLLYQQDGHETYVKTHAVAGVEYLVDKKVSAFINQGVALHEQLTQATVMGLTSSATSIEKLVEETNKWYTNQIVIDQVEGAEKGKMAEFAIHVHKASEFLNQYRESNSSTSLWKAQQKLLEAVIAYEQLVNELR